NLGRLCNQACHHCHVDASPAASGAGENASPSLVDEALELMARAPEIRTLDITGGAPELNPSFRRLVAKARGLGRRVYVRHNLTVQQEAGQADLPEFFAEHQVTVFSSLPCYSPENVDSQRGKGVFAASIAGLRHLNAAGYGDAHDLVLVFNPGGPHLPPPQDILEQEYREQLLNEHGISFTSLATITNMPIHRFERDLERRGELDDYLELLAANFNASTLDGLMCRRALSLRWDGRLFDCDFNLVQGLALEAAAGVEVTLRDLLAAKQPADLLRAAAVAVAEHCFACAAGTGSSCGGALS
ncbi:MAG TPA: arsenosugar biosynthesis radical SAM (seleno)protein ArsS, partial [Planctomycetota bacterium]|nr:arsenosugar biosynthesis radical SAM (seleno)protein ArsS [Planctomycetota bacterium]